MAGAKAAARAAAERRRAGARDGARERRAQAALLEFLKPFRGHVLSGYMPIRSEISPLPVMEAMAAHGPLCLPVVEGAGRPLSFRAWAPGAALEKGVFGAMVPAGGRVLVPEVLIVPLLAFDARGQRLGYGGGFYDRTLEMLRARGDVLAVGFAFAAQEAARLPAEPTDQPLDAIVTENGVLRPSP